MPEKRIILAGGGSSADSQPLDEIFAHWIGPAGRLLYLPLAMHPVQGRYQAAELWLSSVFRPLGVTHITTWNSLEGFVPGSLEAFDAIYIGGGNTFRLLDMMRRSAFDQALVGFIRQGGAVYGGSAGAIVLGREIGTCAHLDTNEVGLEDFSGLDMLNGYSVWCHYQEQDDERIQAYIQRTGYPVLALSERAGVCVQGEQMSSAGFASLVKFNRTAADNG